MQTNDTSSSFPCFWVGFSCRFELSELNTQWLEKIGKANYDADDFYMVSTWLPSISFQSAEPHLMVLEQHCAAKVNLIAAEGPLEEDRMAALHGFSKFRIWNQLDVSMCD